MNNIDFIKNNFKDCFEDVSKAPEGNVQHDNSLYNNRKTHCRSSMYTFTKMLKAKNVLEIGSMNYDSSKIIAQAMQELNIKGFIDTIDIIKGGVYNSIEPDDTMINIWYWRSHHTSYNKDIINHKGLVYPDFIEMTNEKIFEFNLNYLLNIAPAEKYDLILVDGDHSYEGVSFDWEYVQYVSHKDTVIVIDDLYDSRHWQVKKFFDELNTIKYDFKDWNDDINNPLQSTGITLKR